MTASDPDERGCHVQNSVHVSRWRRIWVDGAATCPAALARGDAGRPLAAPAPGARRPCGRLPPAWPTARQDTRDRVEPGYPRPERNDRADRRAAASDVPLGERAIRAAGDALRVLPVPGA